MYEVKVRVLHDTKGWAQNRDMTDSPCHAITVGAGGNNASHYVIEYYLTDTIPPAYAHLAEEELAHEPFRGH